MANTTNNLSDDPVVYSGFMLFWTRENHARQINREPFALFGEANDLWADLAPARRDAFIAEAKAGKAVQS